MSQRNVLTDDTSQNFLIIGSGRVAHHLRFYLHNLNLRFSEWDRSQDPHLLATKREECTHVLLVVSDQAIETTYRKHFAGHDKVIVHFSGALNVPEIIAAHPLMTFGPELYAPDFYEKIHFVISGCESLQKVLPGLPNPFSILPAEQKALYHAQCVMGGNFVTLLIQKMLAEFSTLGIPASAAQLYVEKIVQNVFANPGGALTGPLARQDVSTVQKNLMALHNDPSEKIYQAFIQAYWPSYPEKKL